MTDVELEFNYPRIPENVTPEMRLFLIELRQLLLRKFVGPSYISDIVSIVNEEGAGNSTVVCNAYLSAVQAVGSGADVQIDLDATLVDTGSKFDAGNNRTTITDAGNYLVSAQISMLDHASDQTYALRVKDSGGNVVAMSYANRVQADVNGIVISVCVPLAISSGDWLALYLFQDTGGNESVRGNDVAFYSYPTYLSVVKV